MSIHESLQAMANEITRLQSYETKYHAEVEKTRALERLLVSLKSEKDKEAAIHSKHILESGSYKELSLLTAEVEKFMKDARSHEEEMKALKEENESLKGVIYEYYLQRSEAIKAIGYDVGSTADGVPLLEISDTPGYDISVSSTEKSLQDEVNHLREVIVKQYHQMHEIAHKQLKKPDAATEGVGKTRDNSTHDVIGGMGIDSPRTFGKFLKGEMLKQPSPRCKSPSTNRPKALSSKALNAQPCVSETKNGLSLHPPPCPYHVAGGHSHTFDGMKTTNRSRSVSPISSRSISAPQTPQSLVPPSLQYPRSLQSPLSLSPRSVGLKEGGSCPMSPTSYPPLQPQGRSDCSSTTTGCMRYTYGIDRDEMMVKREVDKILRELSGFKVK